MAGVTREERDALKRLVDECRRRVVFENARICPHCDVEFEALPSRPTQRFCCDAHRRNYNRRKTEATRLSHNAAKARRWRRLREQQVAA